MFLKCRRGWRVVEIQLDPMATSGRRLDEAGCGVDLSGGPDCDKQSALAEATVNVRETERLFPKPDDMRPQCSPQIKTTGMGSIHLQVSEPRPDFACLRAAYFEQLAVQMMDLIRTGPFMQVVDVLRDQIKVIWTDNLFQLGERMMSRIGFNGWVQQRLPPPIVKGMH